MRGLGSLSSLRRTRSCLELKVRPHGEHGARLCWAIKGSFIEADPSCCIELRTAEKAWECCFTVTAAKGATVVDSVNSAQTTWRLRHPSGELTAPVTLRQRRRLHSAMWSRRRPKVAPTLDEASSLPATTAAVFDAPEEHSPEDQVVAFGEPTTVDEVRTPDRMAEQKAVLRAEQTTPWGNRRAEPERAPERAPAREEEIWEAVDLDDDLHIDSPLRDHAAAAAPPGTGSRDAAATGGCSSMSMKQQQHTARVAAAEPQAEIVRRLERSHGEVEMLLRIPLDASADRLQTARDSVADGLAFDDELGSLAAQRGVRKGEILQALIEAMALEEAHGERRPEGGRPEAGGQCGGGADPERYGQSPDTWAVLAHRCDRLRKLIRIKLGDDNDMLTARQGLLLCDGFFGDLERLVSCRTAESGGVTVCEFDTLATIGY